MSARPSPILSGDLGPAVLRIALPTVGSTLLMMANSFADRFFLGKLGSSALAAVATVNEIKAGLITVLIGVSVGAAAIVGRSVGAGKFDEARDAARQALVFALLLSLPCAALLALVAQPLLGGLGLTGDALSSGVVYLRWALLSLPSLFLLALCNGLYGVLGETKRALWVVTAAVVSNVALDPLLIFGAGGIPGLGIAGGGAALCVSQTVAVGLFLHGFSRTRLEGILRGDWVPRVAWVRRLYQIGSPAVVRQLVATSAVLGIHALLLRGPEGNAVVAAYGIGFLLESFALLPGNAYAGAAAAFVSQNLGAGNVARAQGAVRAAVLQAMLAMGVGGALFAWFAPEMSAVFFPGSDAMSAISRQQTIAYLRTVAFTEPVSAVFLVLAGALNGAGDTRSPRTITFATTGLRLALVLALARAWGMGAQGAWLALAISPLLGTALMVAAWRKGRWRRAKV